MGDNLERYKKTDGVIDWGKRAVDQLSAINNQSFKKTTKLEDLPIFKTADKLSDMVWDIVSKWDYFSKKTVGGQWVRSTDSIVANIAEGYGRYFFGEYIVFLYYARGSLYESKFWLGKAHKRGLLNNNKLSIINNKSNDQLYNDLKLRFDELPIEINKVIKIVKSEDQKWKVRSRY